MKVNLQSGRNLNFSEEELSELKAILEKHFSSGTAQIQEVIKVAQTPTEGEWFEVKPYSIDQKLFKKKRKNKKQEMMRQLIVDAFIELKRNRQKYGRNFKTMMPKKTWTYKTIAELISMSWKIGDHNADWVEQALEWAQRIANGETWKAICNESDTANYYRLVVWKNGHVRIVGGSISNNNRKSASYIHKFNCNFNIIIEYAVPLVVSYKD